MESQSALEEKVDFLQPPLKLQSFVKMPFWNYGSHWRPWMMGLTVFGVSLSLKVKSKKGLTYMFKEWLVELRHWDINCNSLIPQLTASQTQGSALSLDICLHLNPLSHLQFCFWTWPDLSGSILIFSSGISPASDSPQAWSSRSAQRRSVTDSTSPLNRYWFSDKNFLSVTIKDFSCGSKIVNISSSSLIKKHLQLMVSPLSRI